MEIGPMNEHNLEKVKHYSVFDSGLGKAKNEIRSRLNSKTQEPKH